MNLLQVLNLLTGFCSRPPIYNLCQVQTSLTRLSTLITPYLIFCTLSKNQDMVYLSGMRSMSKFIRHGRKPKNQSLKWHGIRVLEEQNQDHTRGQITQKRKTNIFSWQNRKQAHRHCAANYEWPTLFSEAQMYTLFLHGTNALKWTPAPSFSATLLTCTGPIQLPPEDLQMFQLNELNTDKQQTTNPGFLKVHVNLFLKEKTTTSKLTKTN